MACSDHLRIRRHDDQPVQRILSVRPRARVGRRNWHWNEYCACPRRNGTVLPKEPCGSDGYRHRRLLPRWRHLPHYASQNAAQSSTALWMDNPDLRIHDARHHGAFLCRHKSQTSSPQRKALPPRRLQGVAVCDTHWSLIHDATRYFHSAILPTDLCNRQRHEPDTGAIPHIHLQRHVSLR